jgi:hypothetical protein
MSVFWELQCLISELITIYTAGTTGVGEMQATRGETKGQGHCGNRD